MLLSDATRRGPWSAATKIQGCVLKNNEIAGISSANIRAISTISRVRSAESSAVLNASFRREYSGFDQPPRLSFWKRLGAPGKIELLKAMAPSRLPLAEKIPGKAPRA